MHFDIKKQYWPKHLWLTPSQSIFDRLIPTLTYDLEKFLPKFPLNSVNTLLIVTSLSVDPIWGKVGKKPGKIVLELGNSTLSRGIGRPIEVSQMFWLGL